MMRERNYVKLLCIALVMCLAMCALTACGAVDVTVTIKDMGTTTEVETSTALTVGETLEKANITLATKDEVEPAADEKITADTTEITVKRYAKVTVVYGDETKEVELVGGTVEDAVKAAGFTVADDIQPDAPLTDYLKNGMTISLVKGVKLTLTVDGKTSELTTYSATIEALLKEQKITLGDDDIVSEKLTAKPEEGMKLTIQRVTFEEVTETEKISYSTEERSSDSLASGTSEVTQEGVDGEKEVTYKVKYIDGKEDSRESVSEKVTKEPVNKIVTYGTKSSGNSDSGNAGSSSNSDNGSSGGSDSGSSNERTVVSKQDMPDCDGSGHGYYIVTYSDGSVEYEEY